MIDVEHDKMTLRVNKENVKFNNYRDNKVTNNTSTCCRVNVINNDVVNVDKKEMEEFWKDTYEDAEIFKKKKKQPHDRLARRRYFAPIHCGRLLNSRLLLILDKAKLRKSALFKFEEVLYLGKANLKDTDGRLLRIKGQKLKRHFSSRW